jgi:hypothetical protein
MLLVGDLLDNLAGIDYRESDDVVAAGWIKG